MTDESPSKTYPFMSMPESDLPVLYVKEGCPYCQKAIDFLEEHGISYQEREVRHDEEARGTLKEVSGQDRTPTLDWHGDILRDFDVEELEPFLREHGVSFEDS